jgi:hypothetical protein
MSTSAVILNTSAMIVIVVIAIIVVCAAAVYILQRTRTTRLKQHFGGEYDRAVREAGDRRQAEARLEHLEKRIERLHIRPLESADRARFQDSWRDIQARFVDDPKGALIEADRLIGEAMSAEGYPVLDFQQRTADISVEHPAVVEHYREGHQIALRHAQGRASTEDLRKAMIHYRTLFDDLVSQPELSRRTG